MKVKTKTKERYGDFFIVAY